MLSLSHLLYSLAISYLLCLSLMILSNKVIEEARLQNCLKELSKKLFLELLIFE
jgi:hypothetical protein